ncbi:hypothetical protein AKJ09_06221 [Labilithrix luteola]|uniref:Uncharacterized protein n=1 Tax=Labilithrix luteola TaxID=1391654 RepID=A0A0K1Q1E1_9BACT|nr:hypothetical protein AKJ09_06221 [Labilithrix luteola]
MIRLLGIENSSEHATSGAVKNGRIRQRSECLVPCPTLDVGTSTRPRTCSPRVSRSRFASDEFLLRRFVRRAK